MTRLCEAITSHARRESERLLGTLFGSIHHVLDTRDRLPSEPFAHRKHLCWLVSLRHGHLTTSDIFGDNCRSDRTDGSSRTFSLNHIDDFAEDQIRRIIITWIERAPFLTNVNLRRGHSTKRSNMTCMHEPWNSFLAPWQSQVALAHSIWRGMFTGSIFVVLRPFPLCKKFAWNIVVSLHFEPFFKIGLTPVIMA